MDQELEICFPVLFEASFIVLPIVKPLQLTYPGSLGGDLTYHSAKKNLEKQTTEVKREIPEMGRRGTGVGKV
jgi:hypothetical protein